MMDKGLRAVLPENNPSEKERYSPAQTQRVRAEAVSNIIETHRDLLRTTHRISLTDADALKQACDAYMQTCTKSGIIPSFAGLAAVLGYSRMGLYKHLQSNPDSPSGIILERMRTTMTAIRQSACDRGAASEALSIFLLKNSYQDFRDRVELAPSTTDNPLRDLDAERARQRIVEAIPIDDEE